MQFPLSCTLILINYLYSPLRKGQDSPLSRPFSLSFILILCTESEPCVGFPVIYSIILLIFTEFL